MPDWWDPHSKCGSAGNSSGIGMQDARQRAALHGQKEETGKETGENLCYTALQVQLYTGQCSPLKISGNFSFHFFDGDFLKQAVTDK